MPTVLITGANRGLGFGFVEAFAKLGWQVIATCRDVDKMPKVEGGVKVYKLCTDSLTDAHIIAGELEAERIFIDVLISNAAVSIFPGRLVDAPPAVVDLTFQTNARGPLVLFQAMKPLLRDGGKFVVVTSMLGSNGREPRPRKGSVSMSYAALNSLIRKLHAEHPEIVVMGLDPGSIKTHMGNRGSRWSGRECAAREVSEVIPGLMKVIDDGDAKDHGGVMTDWEGKVVAF